MNEKTNHPSPGRSKVRLTLDSDVIEYFKSPEEYEERINEILREHVDELNNNKV